MDQQVHVAKQGFRAVWTKSERLPEGKIGFLKHPRMLWCARFRSRDTPGINAGDGAAQLRKGLLRLVIPDKFSIAGKTPEVAPQVSLLGPSRNVPNRSIIGNPIAA